MFSAKLRYDLRLLLEVNRIWLRFPACMEEGLACPRSCREKESKSPKYLLLFDSLSICCTALPFLSGQRHLLIQNIFSFSICFSFYFLSFPTFLWVDRSHTNPRQTSYEKMLKYAGKTHTYRNILGSIFCISKYFETNKLLSGTN